MAVDFLSDEQAAGFGRFPDEVSQEDLERFCWLDDADLSVAGRRRGMHNRLGFAVQLATVRVVGRFLTDPLDVPWPVVESLAGQLGIADASVLKLYAQREQAGYEHAAEISAIYGYVDFADPATHEELKLFLSARAWTSAEGPVRLFERAAVWLRERKVLLPGVSTLTCLVSESFGADCHACHMTKPNDLLAVLVDADNVPPAKIGAVLAEVARFGTASVKRVYGDWTKPNLSSWKPVASEHVIQPMQQFANTIGKNATDSALIIDAMDLLYTRRFHGFCIVSSDSDFTRLASRIREEGVTVYGFGEWKTPEAFRNACDRFTYLDVLEEAAAETTSAALTRVPPPKLRSDTKLISGLRTSVTTASGEDGWANLATVGQLMRKQQPDFDSRNWGYAKLSDLVRATELFLIETRPAGGLQLQNKKKNGD